MGNGAALYLGGPGPSGRLFRLTPGVDAAIGQALGLGSVLVVRWVLFSAPLGGSLVLQPKRLIMWSRTGRHVDS